MDKLKIATKTETEISSFARIMSMTGMILGASAIISLILTWLWFTK